MTKKSNIKQDSALPAAAEANTKGRPDPVELALKTKWSFPTQSKCPRCGGFNTLAVSTQKSVQYRQCRAAICLKRYTVFGKKV